MFNPTYLPHATLTLSQFTLTVYASINFLKPAQIHCSSGFSLFSTPHNTKTSSLVSLTVHICSQLGCSSVLTTHYSLLSAHESSHTLTSTHNPRFCWFLYRCRRLDSLTDLFLNIVLCLRDRFQFYCLFLKLFKHNIFHFIV